MLSIFIQASGTSGLNLVAYSLNKIITIMKGKLEKKGHYEIFEPNHGHKILTLIVHRYIDR